MISLEELMLSGYRRDGRTTKWGEDLSPDHMAALHDREIVVLLDRDGRLYSELLMDSYGTIREKRL